MSALAVAPLVTSLSIARCLTVFKLQLSSSTGTGGAQVTATVTLSANAFAEAAAVVMACATDDAAVEQDANGTHHAFSWSPTVSASYPTNQSGVQASTVEQPTPLTAPPATTARSRPPR